MSEISLLSVTKAINKRNKRLLEDNRYIQLVDVCLSITSGEPDVNLCLNEDIRYKTQPVWFLTPDLFLPSSIAEVNLIKLEHGRRVYWALLNRIRSPSEVSFIWFIHSYQHHVFVLIPLREHISSFEVFISDWDYSVVDQARQWYVVSGVRSELFVGLFVVLWVVC